MSRVRRPPGQSPALVAAGLVWALGAWGAAQMPADFPGTLDEHPAIGYAERPTTDPVSRLNAALEDGRVTLASEAPTGFLRSVLRALDISETSQILVFSKTALQRDYTSPVTPRAFYFNDSVIVGYIAGAPVLEVAAHDPQQGVQFFTLEPPTSGGTPTFLRNHSCLTCHLASSTLDVPGFIARSHMAGADGKVLPRLGSFDVNHTTPHTERWGGWFVTGTAGAPPYGPLGHLGNITVTPHPTSGPVIFSDRVLVDWLNRPAAGDRYLSRQSDLAALMTFDHQMHALNLFTRVNWEARVAASQGRTLADDAALRARVDELADYLLFVDEAPLAFTVEPRPGFVEAVRARYPADVRGRSLAEYDLERRLLKYGCSYLIYHPGFTGLPAEVKTAVYRRIFDVAQGRLTGPRYQHLSAADRLAIAQILRDTVADLPSGVAGPPLR
jgi:hypothetical protein